MMARAMWMLLACAASLSTGAVAQSRVRVGVMGLFHAQMLVVENEAGTPLQMRAGGQAQVIGIDGTEPVQLKRRQIQVETALRGASSTSNGVSFAGRDGGDACFVLTIPGKLRRRYCGTLKVEANGRELLPVVEMERETAVASIVAAELPADEPIEALKAQAVVARSYLAGSGKRHAQAEFCDTTHCQFLREPPPEGSAARRAAEETAGLVLTWQGAPFAAMYSGSCGGRTHSLAELGERAESYPYFAVECAGCRRSHGKGAGGHGIGFCQNGASAMAREGFGFRAILEHYFPNTSLRETF